MLRAEHRLPTAESIDQGAKYWFGISRDNSDVLGQIANQSDTRWTCRSDATQPRRAFLGLFDKPDFVVVDDQLQEVVRIRRCSRILPRFEILRGNVVAGTICLQRVLLNKYKIDLCGGPQWSFQLPPFTRRYRGVSDSGQQLWVTTGASTMEWYVLVDEAADDFRLIAALGFIHHKWWYYG